jgi:hypothetical protein
MSAKHARRGACAAAWLVAAALAGCGEPAGGGVAVAGKVTLGGEPVEEGIVTMIPLDGAGESVTAPIRGGAFETTRANGPSPGKHRVEVRAFASASDARSSKARARAEAAVKGMMFGKAPADMGATVDSTTPRVNVAPERYNARSELTAEIPAAESHTLEFTLAK